MQIIPLKKIHNYSGHLCKTVIPLKIAQFSYQLSTPEAAAVEVSFTGTMKIVTHETPTRHFHDVLNRTSNTAVTDSTTIRLRIPHTKRDNIQTVSAIPTMHVCDQEQCIIRYRYLDPCIEKVA